MSTLQIRHVAMTDDKATFQVARLSDGKSAPPVEVVSPIGFPVESRSTDLMHELRWYLEEFLKYPFSPETEHADRVLAALKAWGTQAFDALFATRPASDFLSGAKEDGKYANLHLQIVSDDPRILGWPWEALQDPYADRLALTCQIERRVEAVADPAKLSPNLPKDRVNILLVTARPYQEDVHYRSISRPLVELIERERLPAHVTVLRPPTFANLREHLRQNPDTYHVLHFDGHGGYREDPASIARGDGGRHTLKAEGVLVFEDDNGQASKVTADQLGTLLRDHAVPAVILNACQSAMIDARAADPFASVATALLKSGTRSVVAMAYSLYVSGARKFVPASYRLLFETGDLPTAVRAGRQEMFASKGRVCARGEFPLEDWLVPVVYQQDSLDLVFSHAKAKAPRRESKLPPEAQDRNNPYGFIGRDDAVLELERALRRPPAAILIQGLGGVGKTTLVRGFLSWLEATQGLGQGCLWFDFRNIGSAEYIVNQIAIHLFGFAIASHDIETKLHSITEALRSSKYIIVWDNFEAVCGIEGTSVEAQLAKEDQAILKELLANIHGCKSKVFITSRSSEMWIENHYGRAISLRGLDQDERWEFCGEILNGLGILPNRNSPQLAQLISYLNGHPLCMRAILPCIAKQSPEQIFKNLAYNKEKLYLHEGDAASILTATLRFVVDSLPKDLCDLLIPLGFHEEFVLLQNMQDIGMRLDPPISSSKFTLFLNILNKTGLIREFGDGLFEIHPVLTTYLRSRDFNSDDTTKSDAWGVSFVKSLVDFAYVVGPLPLPDQKRSMHFYGANLRRARIEAARLRLPLEERVIIRCLSTFAFNRGDFDESEQLINSLQNLSVMADDKSIAADYYQRIGSIAAKRHNYEFALINLLKAITISEEAGDDLLTAKAYLELGILAQDHERTNDAMAWLKKSMYISEKIGVPKAIAAVSHEMGMIAQKHGAVQDAEKWFLRALELNKAGNDEFNLAISYYQLGMLYKQNNKLHLALQYHNKSASIRENIRDEHGLASSYHCIGTIYQVNGKLKEAEVCLRKAIDTMERLGNQPMPAVSYAQLALLMEERGNLIDAICWTIKARKVFLLENDFNSAHRCLHQFRSIRDNAPADQRPTLDALWRDAGFEP